MAEYEDEEYWSDQNEDRTHSITLIPDGKAPVITGIEALENAGNIDMTEESKDFVNTATDDGSGMRNLVITITNLDNRMQRTYSSDTGNLIITMDKDDYLFLGDFAVSAEATDNVGNSSLQESESLAFTLDAELKRAREPQNGVFKAGDRAVLTVTTGGYAEKVIIRFPEELTKVYSILFIGSVLIITGYLILAAREDARSFEVTRIKHLMGFIPALCILLLNLKKLSMFDLGITVLFVVLCLIIGVIGIYGMADGFAFANLTVLFGGIGGIAGVVLVVLVMILACFSGMIEILMHRMLTFTCIRKNKKIAFVPHILLGYGVVMIALLIWI